MVLKASACNAGSPGEMVFTTSACESGSPGEMVFTASTCDAGSPFTNELRAQLWRIERKLDRLSPAPHELVSEVPDECDMLKKRPVASHPLHVSTFADGLGPEWHAGIDQAALEAHVAVRPDDRDRMAKVSQKRAVSRSEHSEDTQSDRPKYYHRALSFKSNLTNLTHEYKQNLEKSVRYSEISGRHRAVDATWQFLVNPDSSRAACMYRELMNPIILASVIILFSQLAQPPLIPTSVVAVFEIALELFFCLDIGMRFAVCPHRWGFAKNVFNLIDIAAVLPLPIRFCARFILPSDPGEDQMFFYTVFLGVVPVLRLFKLLRRFPKFHLIVHAFSEAFAALPVLLYTLSLMLFSFSVAIFLAEHSGNVQALPQAVWLVLVTMMTVGYGDIYPVTTAGRFVMATAMLCSMLYMAMPIGIVGSTFSQVWSDRHRLLLTRRMRDSLEQMGYTSSDILEIFAVIGTKKEGEMTLREFHKLLDTMNVGLDTASIRHYFLACDRDQRGTITKNSVFQQLYPDCNCGEGGVEDVSDAFAVGHRKGLPR